jgi:hypothetical protein
MVRVFQVVSKPVVTKACSAVLEILPDFIMAAGWHAKTRLMATASASASWPLFRQQVIKVVTDAPVLFHIDCSLTTRRSSIRLTAHGVCLLH